MTVDELDNSRCPALSGALQKLKLEAGLWNPSCTRLLAVIHSSCSCAYQKKQCQLPNLLISRPSQSATHNP
jgi:hypothetical protein